MKTKLFAVLLAGLLACPCVSCARNAGNAGEAAPEGTPVSAGSDLTPSAEEAPETEPETEAGAFPDDGLGDKDFGGYDFRILSCYFNDFETADYIIYGEMTGDMVNDQLYVTKQALEDRFNITMSVIKPGDKDQGKNAFKAAVAAEDNLCDMHIGHDNNTFDLGINGLCYNLRTIEQFDFEKPWWPRRTTEELTVNGKLYAASNYASYAGINMCRVLSVNKDLLGEYNIPVPYDMVREGSWTWDNFYSIVGNIYTDENGNGKKDKGDRFGIIGDNSYYYCIQEDFELSAYKKDESEIPYLDMDIEKVDAYVEKMRAMFAADSYLDVEEQYFATGNSAFVFCQVKDINNYYRDTEVKYRNFTNPKFDENQKDYINCCTDCPWAIPVTLKDADKEVVGTVIEAVSCMNYNTLLPLFTETILKAKLADSPDDSEMVQIIIDTRTISFAYSYNKMQF
ncbi:MAG: hypothetical protein II680_01000, partial [Clostridia bacterium]|nr:hypothetical protein [Clostridia bacterium]